ncbi:LysR family transcriptional regulator [Morganella psychrotolerans]|nr:LysR family transcriptional regulator [Morganella psychrotolerans]OBU08481.1 LysR family transcriptional regulator [Morganella psychrotolerans]
MHNNKNRITLRAMAQFIAVAEELSFHRAAQKLNMSQPPLTNAIRKLEEDMNVVLIERNNRISGLTAAGKHFLYQARTVIKQAEAAVTSTQDLACGRTGFIRLGYVGSALYGRLPDIIQQFRLLHPGIRLELREATTAAQIDAIRNDELDISIIIPPLTSADDITQKPFDTDRLCIALPKAHPLNAHTDVTLSQLSDLPFILWPADEGRSFHLKVFQLCIRAGFVPVVAQEAHSMHAVLSLVAAGAGVSVVPQSMRGFYHDKIRYHALGGHEPEFALMLGFRELSPSGQAFVRIAENTDTLLSSIPNVIQEFE